MVNSTRQDETSTTLHLVFLLLLSGLWVTTTVLLFVPNNKLHQMGLGNAIAVDLSLGVLFAFCIAVASIMIWRRRSCPLPLFALVQFLAWGHSVGIWLLLFVAAFFAIQHGL